VSKTSSSPGTGTQFQIRGGAALIDPYPLTLRVDGDLDAAIAGLFTDAVSAQGRTKVQVAVTGTAQNPRFGGSVELVNVQATIPAANAVIENFSARADMLGQQITISSGSGSLNGGTLTAKGTAELKNGKLANVALDLQSRNSAWNIPDGLDTATNIDLRLEGTAPQLTLSGDVRILEGSYRERLIIERGILNSLQQSATSITGAQQRLPVNLNVRLRTISPILVSNDLLNGAIRADLRFRGTLQRPGLTGRLTLEEGGSIYLGGRNYLTERASATFTNERRIEPVLDVLARTKAGGREITLEARGVVGNKLETHFTSDDGLSEPDVPRAPRHGPYVA
jgi:autotransporter translocation and assembly factor TamB